MHRNLILVFTLSLISFSLYSSDYAKNIIGKWQSPSEVDPEFPFSKFQSAYFVVENETKLYTSFVTGQHNGVSKFVYKWIDQNHIQYVNNNFDVKAKVNFESKNKMTICILDGGCRTYGRITKVPNFVQGEHELPLINNRWEFKFQVGNHYSSEFVDKYKHDYFFPRSFQALLPQTEEIFMERESIDDVGLSVTSYTYLIGEDPLKKESYGTTLTLWLYPKGVPYGDEAIRLGDSGFAKLLTAGQKFQINSNYNDVEYNLVLSTDID